MNYENSPSRCKIEQERKRDTYTLAALLGSISIIFLANAALELVQLAFQVTV